MNHTHDGEESMKAEEEETLDSMETRTGEAPEIDEDETIEDRPEEAEDVRSTRPTPEEY